MDKIKNTNAKVNDFLKTCEKLGHPIISEIPGTQRTLRQRRKQWLTDNGEVYVHFKGFWVLLNAPLSGSKSYRLPPELKPAFQLLVGQSPKERIEAESEIIAGCRLLGASYRGKGQFTTPCGKRFKLPLDHPVKAQEVRDAVICDLAWNINKKPQINLTPLQ